MGKITVNIPATPGPVSRRLHKMFFRRFFCTNLRLEAPLLLCVLLLYDIPSLCHNSSRTSGPKMQHPAMDSSCSHYSVAKRQQFPCRLRTATLSLKFPNVAPAGWIWFFPCSIQVIIFLLFEQVRVRVLFFFLNSGSCSKIRAHGVYFIFDTGRVYVTQLWSFLGAIYSDRLRER